MVDILLVFFELTLAASSTLTPSTLTLVYDPFLLTAVNRHHLLFLPIFCSGATFLTEMSIDGFDIMDSRTPLYQRVQLNVPHSLSDPKDPPCGSHLPFQWSCKLLQDRPISKLIFILQEILAEDVAPSATSSSPAISLCQRHLELILVWYNKQDDIQW